MAEFEIRVEAEFSAAHAITVAGVREPVHGHNWHVAAGVTGAALDADGLLLDFHTVEHVLRAIASELHNTDLNRHEAFLDKNASAEHVAVYFAEQLNARALAPVGPAARLAWVRVTEAPRCSVTYRPSSAAPRVEA
jgi:6-pyruvoyl-tetrahydropterin synthase